MNLTYRELEEIIHNMPEDRKDDNVTAHASYINEFYPVESALVNRESDVLDNGHYYLEIAMF